MNDNAASKHSLHKEESALLLEEKTLSDIESDAGRAEIDTHFSTRRRIWASNIRRYAHGLLSFSWRSVALRTVIFLLPSFVQPRLCRDAGKHGAARRRPGPTAYLDGMRGLAALFVFFCHYFYTCFIIAEGWGHGEHNYHLLKLPIIRLFYQGPPMVCVFFVVSGYALSLKPLRLARSRPRFYSSASTPVDNGFAAAMSSFVFRRGIRLFAPTAASTLLIVVMIRAGLYEWTRDFADDATYMRNVRETHYRRLDTTTAQLADWAWALFKFVHVWSWQKFGGSMGIDVHLWTIPVEFRASMMLFLTLVGTARLKSGVRFLCMGLVMLFTYRSDRWDMLLFYFGMVLAEWDLIRGAHSGPSTNAAVQQADSSLLAPLSGPVRPRRRRLRAAMWIILSVLALYLMSQPDIGFENTPGWKFLSSLIPHWFSDKYRYWQCVGSVLFVLSVGHSPAWQRVFNTSVVQYFGKISYALYLMHGPVLHTFGYATERWMWGITGIEGSAYVRGFVLASLLVVPMVIWAADVFWRAVDEPSVRFAKWLEMKCSISD